MNSLRKTSVILVCLLSLLIPAQAQKTQSLQRRIQAVIQSDPDAARAFWGFHVIRAKTGAEVASLNKDRYFVPASNTKLFTSAVALQLLGVNHRFLTTVEAAGPLDEPGVLRSDIVLAGKGDPTLSGRVYPYDPEAPRGDALGPLAALADQVYQAGVREVQGDVVGDDTAYEWDPYPTGWAESDIRADYGAAVSALTLNDNVIRLHFEPSYDSGPPTIRFSPDVPYFQIVNRLATHASAGSLEVIAMERSRQLILGGGAEGPVSVSVAVDDPALFAAVAFRRLLEERGIRVGGSARARHKYPGERFGAGPHALKGKPQAKAFSQPPLILARRLSPPLIQILQVINKNSQNLHAEILLREIGRVKAAEGSRHAGLQAIQTYLEAEGIAATEFNLSGGSGLSRLDLVTPSTVTALLRRMWRSPLRDQWVDSLAIGGREGTMSTRLTGVPGASRVRAKTGTLTHVTALSGYLLPAGPGQETLIFSILVNNATLPPFRLRELIDTIAIELLS